MKIKLGLAITSLVILIASAVSVSVADVITSEVPEMSVVCLDHPWWEDVDGVCVWDSQAWKQYYHLTQEALFSGYPPPPNWGYPAPQTPEASSITSVPPTLTPWPTPEETIQPTH